MNLKKLLSSGRPVLMEGALGERLKTEYRLTPDANVALARFVYQVRGMDALSNTIRSRQTTACPSSQRPRPGGQDVISSLPLPGAPISSRTM